VALRLAMSFLCHQSEYIRVDNCLNQNLQNFDNSQNFLRFVFILLVFVFAAYGQQTTVAVLPSEGDSRSGAELEALTDEMREAALKALPAATFVLLKQDVVVKRLGGAENFIKECKESTCIVDLGKKAQVDYVAQATILELDGIIRLKVELYSVSTEGLVGMFNDEAGSIRDLLAIVKNRAPAEVFSKIPGVIVVEKPVPVKKKCDRKYNVNEVIFKIKDGFPAQLKNCSQTLAKDMLNPFGKKLEPKSFMMQCSVDGIKKELPEGFPNADKILGSLGNFVQGLLSSAMAGGALDPKKLVGAVGSMNISGLLEEVRELASDECVVVEPYEPPGKYEEEEKEKGDSDKEKGKSRVSFGIRAGANLSHTYANTYANHGYEYHEVNGDYGDILGMQLGFVLDFAISDWFHIQPNLIYIQKGMRDYYDSFTSHCMELPLLLSLKLSAFRLNVGPYFGLPLLVDRIYYSDGFFGAVDIGLSTGMGFDIGMFYIGLFYDYGLRGHQSYGMDYDRTLGLNVGVNL